MCSLSCPGLWFGLYSSSYAPRGISTLLTTFFNIQPNKLPVHWQTGLYLWHFLSCALKHWFVFSRLPLQRRFDLYQSLWHMTGTRWWLSRRPPWLPTVQQMTTITSSTPLRHTSCCLLQPCLVAPPETMTQNSRSFINTSSSIRWLWCLNNWTSAEENENKKFSSSLLTHSTLVIFQPLLLCRGLRVFQWQHVTTPAVIWANC